MKPILFTIYSDNDLFHKIQKILGYDYEIIKLHEFPDHEVSLKIQSELRDRVCIIFESLFHPNTKILPILFLAETARDLGAKKIGLLAPYLSYMRQDTRFNDGESVTARYFAKLLSQTVDWLITLDPHLHRIQNLKEIYSIPTCNAHASSSISNWIKNHVKNPIIIGPDQESDQWVSEIASRAEAPYCVLQKIRRGDQNVDINIPEIGEFKYNTPVLVDDIISSAATMIKTLQKLHDKKMKPSICIGIHGLFADNAYENLKLAGALEIITCNTITHVSNQIDISQKLCEAIELMCGVQPV